MLQCTNYSVTERLKCYIGDKENSLTETTCDTGDNCCYGLVYRNLEVNETVPAQAGGWFISVLVKRPAIIYVVYLFLENS